YDCNNSNKKDIISDEVHKIKENSKMNHMFVYDKYSSQMSDLNIELTYIEFILVFFCEYFYFLLTPCIYLFPLLNTSILHNPGSDFVDILNKDLQHKLLHILYYHKLQLKNLNYFNLNISLDCRVLENIKNNNVHIRNGNKNKTFFQNQIINKKEKTNIGKEKGETEEKKKKKYIFDDIKNDCMIEDIVIVFRIIQNKNTKHVNVCNLFIEYIHVKLNLTSNENDDNENVSQHSRNKNDDSSINDKNENSYTEMELVYNINTTFQELFYQFIIALMSLFYFLKIIHIPSSFVRSENDHNNFYFSLEYNNNSNSDQKEEIEEHSDSYSKQEEKQKSKDIRLKLLQVNETEEKERLLKQTLLSKEGDIVSAPINNINNFFDMKYKNYVFDTLGNINIRKLIYGKNYIG
ncbi:conserved protein, unknown function, partial [Hepatocystis sp. ex Piliocolobus tephrosceles]